MQKNVQILKKSSHLVLLLITLSFFVLTGCQEAQKQVEETQNLVENVNQTVENTKNFVDDTAKTIEETKNKIDQKVEQAEQASDAIHKLLNE